jgi:ribosomal protein S18 acetylase RimI-like enzyme
VSRFAFESRPYVGAADLDLLIDFARNAMAARWPRSSYWHPGDVVWQVFPFTGGRPVEEFRLWFDGEGLAGFVLFEPPLNFRFDVRPGLAVDGPLLSEMLTWAEGYRRTLKLPGEAPKAYAMLGEGTISAAAFDSDAERIEALNRHGYVESERADVRYSRSLEGNLPAVKLPHGFVVRHATDADIEARAELHRDAWSVWGPSTESARRYARRRTAPVYDAELDIVVEAADGQLVSYCICWADAATGVGTFEPVGTRPAFAGQGLARAAIYEGFRRLRERGMHTALVGTAGVNERALRLYPSCGFVEVDRERLYSKRVMGV